jgi:arylsulfatase A-like enzyme
MITRMDRGIGDILRTLEEMGVADNTVVIFTSDNGPTFNGGTDSEFFASTGGLRGLKTSLYEGGIRVPLIVRWPGRVEPGTVADHVSAFWDYLPTLAEIAGAPPPGETDGLSMVPVLTGDPEDQPTHERLYWEYHGGQALLSGQWKAVRVNPDEAVELYDLSADPSRRGVSRGSGGRVVRSRRPSGRRNSARRRRWQIRGVLELPSRAAP